MDRNDKDHSLAAVVYSPKRLDDGDSDIQLDLPAIVRRLKRRKRLIATIAASVLVLGIVHSLLQRPSYESTARLLISSGKGPSLLSMTSIPMPADIQKMFGGSSAETEAQVISDDQLLQSAYNRLSKSERKAAFGDCLGLSPTKTRKLLQKAVVVEPKKGTDVLEVRVRSYSSQASARLANAIVQTYFDEGFDQNSRAIRKARQFAQNKMHVLRGQLSEANRELAKFKEQSHIIAPEAQMEKLADYMINLQTELDTATTEHASQQRQIASMEAQISKEKPEIVGATVIMQNPRVVEISKSIDELYDKRAEQLQEFLPQSPEIRALDAQIKDGEDRLKRTTQMVMDSETRSRNPVRDSLLTAYATALATEAATDASVRVLQSKLDEQKKMADSLPEEERKLVELQGQVDLLARVYGLVSEQYYNLLLAEQQNTPKAQLVSKAIAESDPVSRGRLQNALLFLVLGTMIGVGTALTLESLDGRIKDPQDAEKTAGYFASSVIPMAANQRSPLVVRTGPTGGVMESFRVLRNNLYFAAIERRLKTLAVTSAGRGEGKTITCANLATAIAMDGKSVILVDCNMDNPGVRALVGKACDYGLTDVLSGGCDVDKAIVSGEQENLFLISSGPLALNFPELLNSGRSRKMFAQLAERFDYVLIDCPSLESLGDVQVISSIADGVLLVAMVERTLATDLASASESLSRMGIPVVGFVVNGAADQARGKAARSTGVDDGLKSDRGKVIQPRR